MCDQTFLSASKESISAINTKRTVFKKFPIDWNNGAGGCKFYDFWSLESFRVAINLVPW